MTVIPLRAPEGPAEALRDLAEATAETLAADALAGDLLEELEGRGDVPRLLGVWLALVELRTKAEEAAAAFEAAAAKLIPRGKSVELAGYRIEAKAPATRKAWDHDGLRGTLIRRVRAGYRLVTWLAGTPDDHGEDAWVLEALVAAARPEWRVTPLRALDVPLDEFCTTTWGPRQLVATPTDQEASVDDH